MFNIFEISPIPNHLEITPFYFSGEKVLKIT